jgi:hypothetical protein
MYLLGVGRLWTVALVKADEATGIFATSDPQMDLPVAMSQRLKTIRQRNHGRNADTTTQEQSPLFGTRESKAISHGTQDRDVGTRDQLRHQLRADPHIPVENVVDVTLYTLNRKGTSESRRELNPDADHDKATCDTVCRQFSVAKTE